MTQNWKKIQEFNNQPTNKQTNHETTNNNAFFLLSPTISQTNKVYLLLPERFFQRRPHGQCLDSTTTQRFNTNMFD